MCYFCRNSARCQHVGEAKGCLNPRQLIYIAKAKADHQSYSFCITGRASPSSHRRWGPQVSPSPVTSASEYASPAVKAVQSRSNQASLKCSCRYHNTATVGHLTLWGASCHLLENLRKRICCRKFIMVQKCTFRRWTPAYFEMALSSREEKPHPLLPLSNFC